MASIENLSSGRLKTFLAMVSPEIFRRYLAVALIASSI
jgi:hypothetical protein